MIKSAASFPKMVAYDRLPGSGGVPVRKWIATLVGSTLATLTLCGSSMAQTTLVDISANFFDCNQGSSTSGASVECIRPLGRSMANGVASVGHVGVLASATTFTRSFAASAGARANFEDFVVFSGSGLGLVPVTINLVINGQLVVPFSLDSVTAGVKAFASIGGTNVGKLTAINQGRGATCLTSSFGGLSCAGTTVSGTLLSQSVLVPLNTPVSIFFELEALTAAANVGESAFADFSHSLDFPLNGPVFNLPDGVTANSATSFIVDNRFTPPALAVPEPATVALMALGLAALVGLARRCALS